MGPTQARSQRWGKSSIRRFDRRTRAMTVESPAVPIVVLPGVATDPSPDPSLEPVRPWYHRLVRPPGQPAWARPALAVLLLGTALLYLWGLGASGWANSFYSAAAQAGSQSWKAFFFGSSDAGNSITVDKTPASLWLMALSVRAFGLSSWSILVPQALCGVAAVGLLYTTVRRWFSPAAGLLAGAVMALTPVAVLMFRFNNPDALLVLLLVAGAYATVRALETASTRWLALVGVLVGFGFLTKMLQALLVVPAFALAYLVAAPTGIWRRVRQLLIAGAAMVAAAGWWVATVELVPASMRPYIGGSQTNSILELTLGYNGFGRLTGDEVGSVGGGPAAGPGGAGPGGGGNGGMWGQTGLTRMFDAESGGQVAWLLPAALLLLVAGLALTWRASRSRPAFVLWGGWLLVTAGTFSFMAGIYHAYYEVALAPAIGALVGIGSVLLWRRRDVLSTVVLSVVVGVTAIWSWVLLGRSTSFVPWLAPTVLVVGLIAAVALLAVRLGAHRLPGLLPRAATAAALGAAVAVGLAGPAAYALDTAATRHSGSIPTAGPSVSGVRGGPGGPGGRGGPGGFGGGPGGAAGGPGGVTGGPGGFAGGPGPAGGRGGGPFGGPTTGLLNPAQVRGGGPGGPGGGLLDAATPSTELTAALKANASAYTWVAAAIGSQSAAGYQLASGEPVMPIGGFNGSDPSPTLEQFQQYVRQGRIHYFLGGDGFQANGGSRASQQIASWVQSTFTATTIGGQTVYDLTAAAK
jgi:4-amino-4-deoxy-L-arabinose transferase-like glycosyltransferase